MPDSAPIARQWVPESNLLTFEEIERVVRVAVGLGIQKIRLTGGEPLLRHDLEELVARIARIPGIDGPGADHQRFSFSAKRRAPCARPACAASASAWIR